MKKITGTIQTIELLDSGVISITLADDEQETVYLIPGPVTIVMHPAKDEGRYGAILKAEMIGT